MQYKNRFRDSKYFKTIGKTIADDKFRNTSDSFWFSVADKVVVNPFDFVRQNALFPIGLTSNLISNTLNVFDIVQIHFVRYVCYETCCG